MKKTHQIHKNFEPCLFISIGQFNHYFTLRETYLHERHEAGRTIQEVRSTHHFNLSQDANEAYSKAVKFAGEYGMRLNTTLESLTEEMNEIKRATAEELAAREKAEKEKYERWAFEKEQNNQQLLEVINAGFFPFGKYQGKAFEKAERSYVYWLIKKQMEFEEGSLLRMVADKIVNDYPELAAPEFLADAYLGQENERLILNVEIVRQASFVGTFGIVYILTMVTPENVCVVSKGSFSAPVGDKLKIKATVKYHDIYNGQAQTVVNRVKVID